MPLRDLTAFGNRTQALRTVPDATRHVAADAALQRVYYQPGRTLTAAALELEARNFEARRGLMGRVLADGITEGLQITLEDQGSNPGVFTLGAGQAMTPNGQDVTVNRARRIDLADLPLRAPDGSPMFTRAGVGVLAMSAVTAQDAQPGSIAGHVAGFAWDQPRDRAAAPYVDLRMVDGAALRLVKLPGLEALVDAPNGLNAAAQFFIDAERRGDVGAAFLGSHVALALFGIDADGAIAWVARHGAARAGGGVRAPRPLVQGGFNMPPYLRRASLDSLMEQVARWRAQTQDGAPDAPMPDALRMLPSAGILSAPGGVIPPLFPGSYARSIAPVRLSEIDALLERSIALTGYDLTQTRDEVTWHIAVPDAYFETELLLTPEVDPAFEAAVETMRDRVIAALALRRDLRAQADVVEGRLDSSAVTTFGADTDAIAGEAPDGVPTGSDATDFAAETRAAFDDWNAETNALLLTSDQRAMIDFGDGNTGDGLVPFQRALTQAVKQADDVVDFGFIRVQADIYRLRQTLLDNEEATKLATFPILAGIAQGSNAMAKNISLKEYFNSVQEGVSTATVALSAARVAPDVLGTTTAFFAASDGSDTSLALTGFETQTAALSARDSLRGATSAEALAIGSRRVTSEGFSLEKGVGAQLEYKEGGTVEFVFDAGKSTKYVDTSEQFLSDAYKDENIYAKIFEESRDRTAQDYALKTLDDKQAGIKYASDLPGAYQDLRTVTIAERLSDPAAIGARNSALRVKADALSSLQSLEVSLEAVRAPIFGLEAQIAVITKAQLAEVRATLSSEDRAVFDQFTNDYEEIYASGNDPVELGFAKMFVTIDAMADGAAKTAMRNRFERLRLRLVKGYAPIDTRELPGLTLQEDLDPTPQNTDESSYFTAAVAILESVVAAFRAAEKRIAAIGGLVARTRTLIATLQEIQDRWRAALADVDSTLAEARHDLNAALALLDEETRRVAEVQARRSDVLAKHARIAIFSRPRRMMPHSQGVTSARILPGVFEDPLPLARATNQPLPDALDTMMDVLRDMPLDWLAAHTRLTDRLRKPAVMDRAVMQAANAAAVRLNTRQTGVVLKQLYTLEKEAANLAETPVPQRATRGGSQTAMAHLSGFYSDLSTRMLKLRAGTDLAALQKLSWSARKAQALKVLSLSDLIAGARDTRLASTAIAEVQAIENVLGSLLSLLRGAPPLVRLMWAERLSVFDAAPRILRASDLPGWSGLDLETRRSVARLIQWLYRQASADRPEAKRLMGDLVHVAVLSAAHAQADQIVSARLDAEKSVSGGDTVEVVIDKGAPEIGSRVDFGLGTGATIRGRIEDLIDGRAVVRVDVRLKDRISLGRATRVYTPSYGTAKALDYVR